MQLVDEIVDGAMRSSVPLADLLRKCRVVAQQLDNEPLKAWVKSELDGYPEGRASLPAYRILRIHARGMFVGPIAILNDQPLSPHVLDQKHREWATTAYLLQSLAVYERLLEDKKGDLRMPWPAEIVVRYQADFIDDFTLNRAWQVIPVSAVLGLVESVRNRLLDFALELQGNLAKAEQASVPIAPEKVTSAFTNIILGGTNVIGAVISGDVNQSGNKAVIKGNFASLVSVLADLGIPASESEALKSALQEDEAETGNRTLEGSRVKAWMQRAIGFLGSSAAKLSGTVATDVLTRALEAYLGLK